MVIVAVWQCDARPGDHHDKRGNRTEKIVIKKDNGKVLVANVPKSKGNETRDRPKLVVDENGNKIIKHGDSETEVTKLNNGKT